MGHSRQAVNLQELWDEMEQLNQSVSALQLRLAEVQQSAKPLQNPRAAATTSAATASAAAPDDSPWDVWPYCWAINLYDWSTARFHSFHENLFIWKLARHNRRAQVAFQRQANVEGATPRLI
jgi:hypothetical protein